MVSKDIKPNYNFILNNNKGPSFSDSSFRVFNYPKNNKPNNNLASKDINPSYNSILSDNKGSSSSDLSSSESNYSYNTTTTRNAALDITRRVLDSIYFYSIIYSRRFLI